MDKRQYSEIMYQYMMLVQNGITCEIIYTNRTLFQDLCNFLVKEFNEKCDLYLKFTYNGVVIFEILTCAKKSQVFKIDIQNINQEYFNQLIFGKIFCSEFLYKSSKFIDRCNDDEIVLCSIEKINATWCDFVERVGYKENSYFFSDDSKLAKEKLAGNHILWCHNRSCTGKTYLGLYSLSYLCNDKIVYNSSMCDGGTLNFLKIILEFGEEFAILIDDLQCDIEFARKLLPFIIKNKNSIKNRNIYIFITSWSSMISQSEFSGYKDKIPSMETKPEKFINTMKRKLNTCDLMEICQDNLALISAALELSKEVKLKGELKLYKKNIFEMFIHSTDEKQLKIIYVLAVLGIYEFQAPIKFIESFGILDLSCIPMAKRIDDEIFLAHREISNFIAQYIEQKEIGGLCERKEIIKKYINFIDNKKKWKALVHLIGENSKTDLLLTSPIWKLMYEFQKSLKEQTLIDPTWKNTPSSMYFVLSTAKMLGIVDEYREVLSSLCENFTLDEGVLNVHYESLQTTYDFKKIKDKMIEEDEQSDQVEYEQGKDICLNDFHKNWLYGLMVGLKSILIEHGYEHLINKIELELIEMQTEEGYWYPKRVPWVTARILIGLAESGYSLEDSSIKRGVDYLTKQIKDDLWCANTGGWNNEYETSSLCLEALIKCGIECDKGIYNQVVNNLMKSSEQWMVKDFEIDGATTACSLIKILGVQDTLLNYINILTKRNIYNVENIVKLDYGIMQSCKTTQIAYYVIELCWYILEKDIDDLLNEFIFRSGQKLEDDQRHMKKIFISYSEDSKYHIKKIIRIVDYLEKEGYKILFYENAPIGTNLMEFMHKIIECDATIIFGTKLYKKKVVELKSGGVFFESCVLSGEFMNKNNDKIIPVAFDEFNESFLDVFVSNKGMQMKRVDENSMKKLASSLKEKFRGEKNV